MMLRTHLPLVTSIRALKVPNQIRGARFLSSSPNGCLKLHIRVPVTGTKVKGGCCLIFSQELLSCCYK